MMHITPIAELVDRLFHSHLRPDGREYSYAQVARAIEEQLGEEIAGSYIGKVRSGAIPNPGHHSILLLSAFFKVPASYFYPDLEPLLDVGGGPTPELLLRQALDAFELPTDVQQHLIGMVLALRQQHEHAYNP